MWLLNTTSAERRFFLAPRDVPGGYAILSHTWHLPHEGEEDTFQTVDVYSEARSRTLEYSSYTIPIQSPTSTEQSVLSPSDSLRRVSRKIQGFLKVARDSGYEWAWADTCCIDKTSSSDLSEAINSMFTYYALADVCLVYLSDVFPGGYSNFPTNEFNHSKWFRRGWTLQELLAPRNVAFFSQDWTFLGNKHRLAYDIHKSTSIPEEVLRFEVDITEKTILDRMSWAAFRSTTREEDQAYSLFGLFGVRIPTMYGEGGRNAFYRLQEEIMKTSLDTSLFAWGPQPGRVVESDEDLNSHLIRLLTSNAQLQVNDGRSHILSPSTREFTWGYGNQLQYVVNTNWVGPAWLKPLQPPPPPPQRPNIVVVGAFNIPSWSVICMINQTTSGGCGRVSSRT